MKRVQWLLFSISIMASFGVLLTGALAGVEIRDQAYLASGLSQNAVRTFVSATRDGALAGALAGAALFTVIYLLRSVWRTPLLRRATTSMPYILCLAVALLAMGGQTLIHGRVGVQRTWAVIAMAAVWCALFLSSRRPFVARRRGLSLFVEANLYLLPALTVVMVFMDATHEALLRRPAAVTAAIGLYLLFFWTIARLSTPSANAGPRLPWLLATPAVVPWIVLFGSSVFVQPGLALRRPANVIVIGIDTLRLDHTSLMQDGRRATSPNLAALASRGTFFENAISQAPWTMPSFASVLTGRYPREHGAISITGYLRPSAITLAELLREAGFETAGIVSHMYVDSEHGFDQGFDDYDDTHVRGHYEVTSTGVTDLALDYLARPHPRPFFLFLHYFDPHSEYRDHSEFDYADDYRGWLRDIPFTIAGVRDRRHQLSEEDIDYLRDLYDEEIAFTDAQIGRVFDYLETTGLDQNTLVIVVADHGEEFMERGWLGHTTSLHEEQVRVPLVIALPNGERQVSSVDTPVETRAVFATVLDFLEPEHATDAESGSLLPLMNGKTDEEVRHVFSEVWLSDAGVSKRLQMTSLRSGHWKLIKNFTHDEESLYDLAEDPGERIDVVEIEKERAKELGGMLEAWSLAMDGLGTEVPTTELTEEQLRQLRSLGYVR